jgi:hypothetical protein
VSSIAERYLLLGLRLGRLVDGLVDGYFGPPELKAAVDAESPDAAALVAEARALRAEIDESDLEPQRRRWLSAQVGGLECAAEMAAGDEVPWSEAVRRCYGIEPVVTPEAAFEETHRRLDAALPGRGELATRLKAWNEANVVPPEKLLDAFDVLATELRARTRGLVDLPEGERFDAVTVSGRPWTAYNWYLGDLASRIEVNTDLPLRSHFFPGLVAHEGYPGHHTEHACKEARLLRELGRAEVAILLVHTPECLVSEGVAEVALEQALGHGWAERAAELLSPLGIPFEPGLGALVDDCFMKLRAVDDNIACFVNERGWSLDEAAAYHRRWALTPEDRAQKAVEFDTHPLWSPYVVTYSQGYELVRAYVSRADGNFCRLLTEQVTTADLLESAA